MEKLRRLVIQIASTPPSQRFSALSPLQLSLIPLLSIASSIYNLALLIRHRLYYLGIFHKRRLPVPVLSVGNLTWGGNGKTPMVEFVARWLIDSGISPLILTRGYGGGDEAKMLQRHLHGTSAKVGVGANRAATAASFLERHGYLNFSDSTCSTKAFLSKKARTDSFSDKIGVAILDDGMQLWRDLEIIMVNGMMPWGNLELIPLGPLREPLAALGRADVVVIHHADLMGPKHVDRLDFSDHHLFQAKDITIIRRRLKELESAYGMQPIVVVTEKDYDRAPDVLNHVNPYQALVLCSSMQILPREGRTEDNFKKFLRERLKSLSDSKIT